MHCILNCVNTILGVCCLVFISHSWCYYQLWHMHALLTVLPVQQIDFWQIVMASFMSRHSQLDSGQCNQTGWSYVTFATKVMGYTSWSLRPLDTQGVKSLVAAVSFWIFISFQIPIISKRNNMHCIQYPINTTSGVCCFGLIHHSSHHYILKYPLPVQQIDFWLIVRASFMTRHSQLENGQCNQIWWNFATFATFGIPNSQGVH